MCSCRYSTKYWVIGNYWLIAYSKVTPQFDDLFDGLGIVDASARGFAGILFGDLNDSLFGGNQRAQFLVGASLHQGGTQRTAGRAD